MSPWASEPGRAPFRPRRWVIVGNPGGRRVTLFQEALASSGRAPAAVVTWADLLTGRADLGAVVRPGDAVRIDSPGRDFAVETLLLARGASEADEEGDGAYAGLSAGEAADLAFDRGEMLCPRQWYRGFRAALALLARQLAAAPGGGHLLLNDPGEIALLFDKPACQARLEGAGVPVPASLGVVTGGFADLTARMAAAGVRRVFLKLAHGSSASGVVAYRQSPDGRHHQAVTTVEVVTTGPPGSAPRLFNTRRTRTLSDPRDIGAVVDALCRHRAHAEVWLPKASLNAGSAGGGARGAFDLRALAVAGRLRHAVARCSRGPMTNLHLLNARAPGEVARARAGEDAWAALEAAVARAARAAFPATLHVGFDVMWLPGFRRLAFLEANAFGDLLPGSLHEGESAYQAQVSAVESGAWTPVRTGALPC